MYLNVNSFYSIIICQARRREQNRLQRIEEAAKVMEEQQELDTKRKVYQLEADERTRKNRYVISYHIMSYHEIVFFFFLKLRKGESVYSITLLWLTQQQRCSINKCVCVCVCVCACVCVCL